jgi:hypothetical protein
MTGATPRHHPLSAYLCPARAWRAECVEIVAGALGS